MNKSILKKIKSSLNNEMAGPNLEAIIGLGASITILGTIYAFAHQAYSWVYESSKIVTYYSEPTPTPIP